MVAIPVSKATQGLCPMSHRLRYTLVRHLILSQNVVMHMRQWRSIQQTTQMI